MRILGFDFETTGLDKAKDSIIEVGMVLWDTEEHTAVKMMDYMVNPGHEIAPHITELTGISTGMCEKYGYESEKGLKQFILWMQTADVLCAHNGREFDIHFLNAWAEKYGYELPILPLIDTKSDLDEQMPSRFSRKLVYMAADHGFLNPFPHRALFDVLTMLRILDKYDVQGVLDFAATPSVMIEAVSTYEQKEAVKAAGFHWFAEKKSWRRSIKVPALETERTRCREAGFEIRVLDA